MSGIIPPFYENWDDTHCGQCVLRGVLEYFEPGTSYDWDVIDQMSGKIPGKWTWPYRQQISMVQKGYDVVSISHTGPQEYLAGDIYDILVHKLGQEAADKQREMSDLVGVRKDMEEYVALLVGGKLKRHDRPANLQDIKDLLAQGYLVASSLNARTLNGREGYASHAVLVYAMTDQDVIFHDSGLPAFESRHANHAEFIAAATNPNDNQWNIRAYRKASS